MRTTPLIAIVGLSLLLAPLSYAQHGGGHMAAGSPVTVFFLPGILQVGVIALIRLPGSCQQFAISFRDFGGRPSPLLPLQILSQRSG